MIEKIVNKNILKNETEVLLIEKREVLNLTVNNITQSEGDMRKSTYDADNDGVVDMAKDLDVNYEDWTQFDLILLS